MVVALCLNYIRWSPVRHEPLLLGGLAFLLASQQHGPSPRGHVALTPVASSPGGNTQSSFALKYKQIKLL